MAGKIKAMVDTIIEKRSQGDDVVATTSKTKFVLKGVHPDKFDSSSPDDPEVIEKVRKIAEAWDIKI